MKTLFRTLAPAVLLLAVSLNAAADGGLKDLLWDTVKDATNKTLNQQSRPVVDLNPPVPARKTDFGSCTPKFSPLACALETAVLPSRTYVFDGIRSDVDGPVGLLYFIALQADPTGGAQINKIVGEAFRRWAAFPDRYDHSNAFDRRDLDSGPAEARARSIEAKLKGAKFAFAAEVTFYDYDFKTHTFPLAINTGDLTIENFDVRIHGRFRNAQWTQIPVDLVKRDPAEPNYRLSVPDEGQARRLLETLKVSGNPVYAGLIAEPVTFTVEHYEPIGNDERTHVYVDMDIVGFSFVARNGLPVDLLH